MARVVLILLVIPVVHPGGSGAAELKIATWNLNWLTTRATGPGGQSTPGLPANVRPRDSDDFARLRRYALELNADVVALQEVDGREAAARVFPAELYSIHMTRDRVTQRVGFAVRRGLPYDANPDVSALALDPDLRLRGGADITLHAPDGPLRLLAVHLKQGCQDRNLRKPADRACLTLRSQIAPLRDWIAARQREGMPFIVLGDFNRRMDQRDPFLAALRETAPLARATEGRSSPCWGAEDFIDHILAGGAATGWMRQDTLRVLTFRETGPEWKDRLSDHCPVSVRFTIPE